MDWFPAVMTLVGVLVGLGVQEFRIWRERKDKYKDIVFEKRLEAHQDAHYRCKRLLGVMMPYKLMKDAGKKAAIEEIGKYYEWRNKNALYLDRDSRIKMNMLFKYVLDAVEKYEDGEWLKNINVREETQKLNENIVEVLYSIEKGLGVDYLPEEEITLDYKIPLDEIVMERIFDERVLGWEGLIKKQKKQKR